MVIDRPSAALPPAGRDEQWTVAAGRIIAGRVSRPIYVSVDAAERVVRAAARRIRRPRLRA